MSFDHPFFDWFFAVLLGFAITGAVTLFVGALTGVCYLILIACGVE